MIDKEMICLKVSRHQVSVEDNLMVRCYKRKDINRGAVVDEG
ncbi:hypothetical protein D088_740044 [Salmonella enterica subsp. houtenae serovar 16:z4,z32:-- str. RKS3027]|nr:hypothetical protein D088_740044 [Salmonella enterica subsp. houtenae serovar 16:z4,z32:-- str. RKS3027]